MKIENPVELATVVAKNDELTAQLAEFEKMKADHATALTLLGTIGTEKTELQKEVEALRTENAEFKEAIDASENVGEQVKAEVAKNVELADRNTELTKQLEAQKVEFTKQLDEFEAQLVEQTEKADAFAELAAEYAKDTEKVQDQFALIGTLLGKKALVPDVEKTTPADEAPQSYTTWLKLANSKNSEDRRMARRMKADSPEIDVFIQKQSGISGVVTPATTSFTPEQIAVYTQWKALRADAEASQKSPAIHANLVKEARRLYKQNQSVIDAQINAAQAA
jgi:DNA repair exonuclease SbcCD ATPase subunit